MSSPAPLPLPSLSDHMPHPECCSCPTFLCSDLSLSSGALGFFVFYIRLCSFCLSVNCLSMAFPMIALSQQPMRVPHIPSVLTDIVLKTSSTCLRSQRSHQSAQMLVLPTEPPAATCGRLSLISFVKCTRYPIFFSSRIKTQPKPNRLSGSTCQQTISGRCRRPPRSLASTGVLSPLVAASYTTSLAALRG